MISKKLIVGLWVFGVLICGAIIFSAVKLYRQIPHFKDAYGNEIPYHVIDSLISYHDVRVNAVPQSCRDTIRKYLPGNLVSLPKGYSIIQPSVPIMGRYDSSINTLFIEFNSWFPVSIPISRPLYPHIGQIYFNKDSLQVLIWNGKEWKIKRSF